MGTQRSQMLGCLAGTVLIGWLGVAIAHAQAPAFMQKPAPEHVRIMCYNVNWDSIFPDGDPDNHGWRSYNMVNEFRRVVAAVNPDIVCLQEINSARNPQDVADILDAALGLGGSVWLAHNGSDNVIAARWNLLMTATDTIPTTERGQAMALVDLPDAQYTTDLYLMNAHFKASGGQTNIDRRQKHSDAIVNWIRDIQTPGGNIDLAAGTPIVTLGDLNVYDTDPHYHLTTLITGDIVFEATYGPDYPPDWDGTDNTDAVPPHNGVGPDFYTWRDDRGSFNPGALDRIIFTDNIVAVSNAFVLNTASMSAADLTAAGLQANDVLLDPGAGYYDHLPLVVDLVVPTAGGGCTQDSECDDGDACNGAETCNGAGACQPGTPPVCDDGVFCDGAETCDPATGCAAGSAPCGTGWWCHEAATSCVAYGTGDFEPDGDVDLGDFAAFQACYGLLGTGACEPANLNGAGSVDADDFAAFGATMNGP